VQPEKIQASCRPLSFSYSKQKQPNPTIQMTGAPRSGDSGDKQEAQNEH